MLDLRPVLVEVCSEISGASCDRVLLDRLEELLLSDQRLEQCVRIELIIVVLIRFRVPVVDGIIARLLDSRRSVVFFAWVPSFMGIVGTLRLWPPCAGWPPRLRDREVRLVRRTGCRIMF